MKKFIVGILLSLSSLCVSPAVLANETVALEHANVDVHDQDSLQRGARYFVNYCMGCHSLAFSRYNRVATDLGLTNDEVQNNLIFTRTKAADGSIDVTKVGELMKNAMRPEDVTDAFGAAPPDLSLTGRSRGADWIYSYLKSFYLDPTRPMGVNNTVLVNAGMPHILWELQGWQSLQKDCVAGHEGEGHEGAAEHCTARLVLTQPGKLPAPEYNQVVKDITNFLVYVGEPAQLHRKTYGVFAVLFLIFFSILAYLLKKEFWKDVH